MNYNGGRRKISMKAKEKSTEYMTVGELAKKMGTTVRTLQYYDKEGLLCPTTESEGGRRLYTYKDMIQLHQILSLKSLGFSLRDIKNKLISLDNPNDVANILTQQSDMIKEQLHQLSKALSSIEALKSEVLEMQEVNFKKYADIIINLQMNNEYYWLIKHFDDETLEHIRHHFDKESGKDFIERFHQLNNQAIKLKEENILPEDQKAQNLAKKFWDMIMEFTQGDLSLLPKLMEFSQRIEGHDETLKINEANAYLQPALEIYFQKSGINPFKNS